MQLSNSAFDNNSAIASGGAIQSERQVFQASNVSFASNHVSGGVVARSSWLAFEHSFAPITV